MSISKIGDFEIVMTFYKKTKICILGTFLTLFISVSCYADRNDKPGVVKRRYIHSCPTGTEQIGDGPPKSSIIFCRQINSKGFSLEGEYVTFFPNGNKKTEGTYTQGKKNGTWKVYSKSGDILETREFKEGLVKKKEFTYAKKYIPQAQTPTNINSQRKFSQDKDVLNALRVTKTKNKIASNKTKYVYGISAR
jgi:hypothetical protein